MNEDAILRWLEHTWLGETQRTVPWLFGVFETFHFVGLSMLIGAMLIVDLRLLGYIRTPFKATLTFTHVAAIGLAINVLTGIAFITADPFNYWANMAFRVKMCLVAVAIMNVLYFEFSLRKSVIHQGDDASTDMKTKIIACLSLGLWATILLLGRLLPQFETY